MDYKRTNNGNHLHNTQYKEANYYYLLLEEYYLLRSCLSPILVVYLYKKIFKFYSFILLVDNGGE